MRVVIIGGTRFIGRRITEALARRGDEVLVVHRGVAEPQDWVPCRHLHIDRKRFGLVAEQVRTFAPDAVVDTLAMTRTDAEAVLPHLPEVPLVVLSSMDVYHAYEFALSGQVGVPVPLGEDSPLREGRYPHRGTDPGLEGYDLDMDHYDKLDVEPLYLWAGNSAIRPKQWVDQCAGTWPIRQPIPTPISQPTLEHWQHPGKSTHGSHVDRASHRGSTGGSWPVAIVR